MALQVKVKTRVFVVAKKNKKDNITLPDPHPSMSIEEVQAHYKSRYPELSTASIDGPKMEENKAVFTFNTVIGTHG